MSAPPAPLSGQVVLVTGGTGAIGLATARRALSGDAAVILHGTDPQRTAAAAAALAGETGGTVHPVAADFRLEGAIESAVAAAVAAGRRLDAVVHCASLGVAGITGPFGETDPAALPALAAAMIGGFERLCRAALPHLAVRGGTLVTLAADSGRFAAPGQAPLAGAYGGLMSFVRSLAMETARDRVRVHCISPSFVEGTPVFETWRTAPGDRAERARKRAGLGLPRPDDIAALALFLCGPDATRMTGQVISVNGGLNA